LITSWNVEAFKSVGEEVSLKMAPLTIFAGANSSGKSTIIQSILLTAQTIQSQVITRPIVLNGHILRLGAFNDILSSASKSNSISIGFGLSPSYSKNGFSLPRRSFNRFFPNELLEAIEHINCKFSFSTDENAIEKELSQLQPVIISCKLQTKGTFDNKNFDEIVEINKSSIAPNTRINQLGVAQGRAKIDLAGLEYDVIDKPSTTKQFLRRYYGSPITGEVVGSGLQHFLPSRFIVKFDVVEESSRRLLEYLFYPEQSDYYEFSSDDTSILNESFQNAVITIFKDSISTTSLPETNIRRIEQINESIKNLEVNFNPEVVKKTYRLLPQQIRREMFQRIDEKKTELRKLLKSGRQSEYNLAYSPLPGFTDSAADYVQAFFASNLKYLGPLRDEPKPVYPLAGSMDPKDIGFKGENTAAVLDVHRNTQIHYIPCSSFEKLDTNLQSRQATLLEAVLDWLGYLGVAHNLATTDKGKLGHELKVSTTGSDDLHDLTHVGVGVSQVLPILVQSLLAEIGSTLVFEQPELHLHPRVQTRLADFFVSMTMLSKQCIIETHSEYLINRLRYMSAIATNDELSKNVILYFVEKDKGSSVYRPIRINKYGVIEDWPRGFFDENEQTASEILKAGMLKRKLENAKGDNK
jgi:predicted ATPase